jgi:hypothetical protein
MTESRAAYRTGARRIERAKEVMPEQLYVFWTLSLDDHMTEAVFESRFVELFTLTGWVGYHTRDSRGSNAGFPDWCLARAPRLLLVELKTNRGRLTPEQRVWGTLLAACPGVEYRVWRPRDWPTILATLNDGRLVLE